MSYTLSVSLVSLALESEAFFENPDARIFGAECAASSGSEFDDDPFEGEEEEEHGEGHGNLYKARSDPARSHEHGFR